MIDVQTIPDPGEPPADGYFLQLARARLHTLGVRTPEDFAARYGVDIHKLTAFGLLYVVAPDQAAREMRVNELYQEDVRRARPHVGARERAA